MAMLAAEHLPAAQGWNVRILATDLDTQVLADAASAVYDDAEIADIPDALRKRYWVRQGSSYKLHRDVTSLVTFAQTNLIAEPFPVRGRFDAVFCRNVMIYFDRPTQQRVVSELTRRIAATGYLVIGHSESMLAQHLPRATETVGVYRPLAAGSSEREPAADSSDRGTAARRPAAAGSGRGRAPVPGMQIRRIVLGEWFATKEPLLVSTLLGSCVAACLFDPVARVGGMNHFMLPKMVQAEEASARFGVHAMEVLINELMHLGAQRARLKAMAFGAGAVNATLSSTVAAQNGAFVRQFLAKEQIPLVCERLGGNVPREVYLRTDTGEAFVRKVEARRAAQLSKTELAAYAHKPEEPNTWSPDDALF
jgi:chemotaxis receptor (MCP) glutamine deamidase CheD